MFKKGPNYREKKFINWKKKQWWWAVVVLMLIIDDKLDYSNSYGGQS